METQVVEEKVEVSGMAWLRSLLGSRAAGTILDTSWNPVDLTAPPPPAPS